MKPRTSVLIALNLTCMVAWCTLGWAEGDREASERTAQHLTTLLNVGRLVVERNQPLINDPRKGDKGFTPDSFEQQVVDEFFRQTAIDLKHPPAHLPALAKDLLPTLLQSGKDIVAMRNWSSINAASAIRILFRLPSAARPHVTFQTVLMSR